MRFPFRIVREDESGEGAGGGAAGTGDDRSAATAAWSTGSGLELTRRGRKGRDGKDNGAGWGRRAGDAGELDDPAEHLEDLLPIFQSTPQEHRINRVVLDIPSVWQAAWVVVAVAALVSFLQFFFSDGASVVFLLVMAFFVAIALEPAVGALAGRMPRALATTLVLLAVAVGLGVFVYLFGGLLVEQVTQLVQAAPHLATSVLDWVNQRFHTSYSTTTVLEQLGLTSDKLTSYATSALGGILGAIGSVLGSAFNAFAFAFFTFYISVGLPKLRLWIAGLFAPRQQVFFFTVWQLILIKVGGYVAARLVLAVINSTAMGIFMLLIGMPYWLPLAIWTGLVAQFVPNVGTYISIVLPVLVGATSAEPMDGLWVFVYAICYQQVENVAIEPRISARAVDVHPVVSFASAIIGANLFGIAGALLGVPVAATVMALFDIYKQRYAVTHETDQQAAQVVQKAIKKEDEPDVPDGEPAPRTAGTVPQVED